MALFTHSYFLRVEPEINSASDYFEAFAVAVLNDKAGTRSNTTEYKLLQSQGFVFCKWIDVNLNIGLMVKPSQKLIDSCPPYAPTAIQLNTFGNGKARVVATLPHDNPCTMTYTRIAGDLELAELEQFTATLINAELWATEAQKRSDKAQEKYKLSYMGSIERINKLSKPTKINELFN